MVQTIITAKEFRRINVKSIFNPLLILFILFVFSCSVKTSQSVQDSNFYYQLNNNRVAAEWEPALGTMIVWPLSIPYKLVIELSKDNHLYTLVANDSSMLEAMEWYAKWGIEPIRNTFIYAPQGIDSWWVRDWGPSAVFSADGKLKLADGKYIYSTPVTSIQCNDSLRFLYMTSNNEIIKTETDDTATKYVSAALNLEMIDLPYINTGGNVLTNGLGSAFSTCILLNENQFFNVSKDSFLDMNKKLLGIHQYNIISNFEKYGIQHIDCYMKLLDEERILVAEPPSDHILFPIYQHIIDNELKKLKTPYGRAYEIIRIKTDRYNQDQLAAYTNSIIINKFIYVPLFRIKEDSAALQRWREVMPGFTVKGFEFSLADEPAISKKMKDHYKSYGWNSGDALHCRTRAVWDTQMLFISVKKIDKIVDARRKNIVYATIIDYSKKGIQQDKNILFWRVKGETDWRIIPLEQISLTDHFYAEIPYSKNANAIEYYIQAASKSGRLEARPASAPLGFYQYSIQ